ncbi:hypothetical protein KFL_000730070 [Klebsormidium nitens]|uniref:EGF-like domain-containing protein n=1 Tax=Klebsormidium nitens TaxID=105231 RepID=A0A1Y1HRB6_KLENI|nr:hypothetical protein KFL_000730070 [Klebsormidium nitens]|eukprot:GAQ81170.1 hypothetical protein KFL_000730070 [Klebsormidium nitens]
MAAFRPNVVFVLVALLALYGAQPAQGQSSGLSLSCPPGYLVQAARNSPTYTCTTDPCYINPCGYGNTCGIFQNDFGRISDCTTCNPPYKRGTVVIGFPYIEPVGVCYLPGSDACNPNPCQNGGVCSYRLDPNTNQPLTDDQGTKYAFQCDCGPTGRTGPVCSETFEEAPRVTATLNGVTGPLAILLTGVCGLYGRGLSTPGCLYNSGKQFICCTGVSGCGPVGPDGVPVCQAGSFTPIPNDWPVQPLPPTPPNPTGDQGVCGSGAAFAYRTRCFFNSDPQGRYVCCDNFGCDGFNADNLTPRCKNNGFVPPNNGLPGPSPPSTPPSTPPSGSQGVCGGGAASDFPTRCYFNNDPQGRYVCCDGQGCDGFNADNLTPRCKNNGYVPPNNGLAGPSPPSTPPSGSQGVCGTGGATNFPLRCWFNNDPQGRYVCCDNDGCNGFNPPDNSFPRCKTNGYVPPGFGI